MLCEERVPFDPKYNSSYPELGQNKEDDVMLHALLGAEWLDEPRDHITKLIAKSFLPKADDHDKADDDHDKDGWIQSDARVAIREMTKQYVCVQHTGFNPDTKKTELRSNFIILH